MGDNANNAEYLGRCRQALASLSSKSHADSTRRNYESRIRKLKEFLQNNYPERAAELLNDQYKYGIVCPVDVVCLEEFIGSLVLVVGDGEEEEQPDDGSVASANSSTTAAAAKKKLPAQTTFEGYLSALGFLYQENGVPNASAQIRGQFKKGVSGLKRTNAERRNNGELPALEGKAPLTFDGYSLIVEYALEETHSASWLYTLLCWNLISRSSNVGNLKFQHICWQEDAMVIYFPKTKTDQEGLNSVPRHVYANPFNPKVCPVLAMAVFVFSGGPEVNGQSISLFKGSDPSARFNAWLSQLWKRIEDDVRDRRGITAVDGGVGSHSFR